MDRAAQVPLGILSTPRGFANQRQEHLLNGVFGGVVPPENHERIAVERGAELVV